jgi:hypothetical protein
MQEHQKWGNAVAFHNVVPVQLHCKKSPTTLSWGTTFENPILNFGEEKKRAELCPSKMSADKVGVNQKYVPYM